MPLGNLQTRLLFDLAQHALVGTLVGLAFAAHAYPFAVAGVVLFLDAVQHQVAVTVVDIAECVCFMVQKKADVSALMDSENVVLVLGVDDGFVHSIPTGGGDTPIVGGVLVVVDANLSSLHFFVSIDTHGVYFLLFISLTVSL